MVKKKNNLFETIRSSIHRETDSLTTGKITTRSESILPVIMADCTPTDINSNNTELRRETDVNVTPGEQSPLHLHSTTNYSYDINSAVTTSDMPTGTGTSTSTLAPTQNIGTTSITILEEQEQPSQSQAENAQVQSALKRQSSNATSNTNATGINHHHQQQQQPNEISQHSSKTSSRSSSVGKKVLHAVATRPWKSVKKRFNSSSNKATGSLPINISTANDADLQDLTNSSVLIMDEDDYGSITKNSFNDNNNKRRDSIANATVVIDNTTKTNLQQRRRSNTNNNMDTSNCGNIDYDDEINSSRIVVTRAELILRFVSFIALAFVAGAHFPHFALSIGSKVAEYATVAWITCIILHVAQAKQMLSQQQHQGQNLHPEQQPLLSMLENDNSTFTTGQPNTARSLPTLTITTSEQQQHQCKPTSQKQGFDAVKNKKELNQKLKTIPFTPPSKKQLTASSDTEQLQKFTSSSKQKPVPGTVPIQAQQTVASNVHPALDPYYVIDTNASARIFPNCQLFPLDTDYFSGNMLVLIRTPDCDNPDAVRGKKQNDPYVQFFRNKQRRFEFQFQLKLKRLPKGRVYFACELEESFKLGMIQRAFVGAAMAFVKTTNNNFHYSLTGTNMENKKDGKWESPHMAFPVEEGMNRVVSTPPGQEPPSLGGEIFESEASIKQRKKGMEIQWNLENTYTFSLWSAYVDFLDWRCLNLPGIRPFSLSSVIGPQPIVLTLYELNNDSTGNSSNDNTNSSKYHYKCDTINIVRIEMCNAQKSGIGPATRSWISDNHKLAKRDSSETEKRNILSSNHDDLESRGDEEDDDEDDKAEEQSLEAEVEFGGDEDEVDIGDDESNDSVMLDQGIGKQSSDLEAAEDLDLTNFSEEAADELGEGLYVRSGDAIQLREAILNEDDLNSDGRGLGSAVSYFLSNGGGFAVLQEQSSSKIIIEKAGKSRFRRDLRSKSRMIRSGDAVVFKLILIGDKETETKYLSIHRGWWLKWVSSMPTKNGFFTIHTHENEVEGQAPSGETQSSYLRIGGSFWLNHKRWSRYRVGVSSEASATYGGRMLGLYIPPKDGIGISAISEESGQQVIYQSDPDLDSAGGKEKGGWTMQLLQLQAYEPKSSRKDSQNEDDLRTAEEPLMIFAREQHTMDVPAWVEILNRHERVRQHVFVVRVKKPPTKSGFRGEKCEQEQTEPLVEDHEDNQKMDNAESTAFVRLRTGRDLAGIMRTGIQWRTNTVSPRQTEEEKDHASSLASSDSIAYGPLRKRSSSFPNFTSPELNASVHSYELDDSGHRDDDSEQSEAEWEVESEGGLEAAHSFDDAIDQTNSNVSAKRNRKGSLIGKIARTTGYAGKKVVSQSVKGTVNAGKATVKGTVNAGKATVNAGKAMLPIRPKKPPMKEPKSGKRHHKSRRGTGLRVDVNTRSIRRIELLESKFSFSDSPSVLAGELSAPEQSCRTVSDMVAKMSSQRQSSSTCTTFSFMLASVVESSGEYDIAFMRGGAVQLGVTPVKIDTEKGSLIAEALVARCLWESHWREEWCGVYESGILFYAPLMDSPCLDVSFMDIKSVRFLDVGLVNPLAGYPLLVVETAWQCHYCAFSDEDTRQSFFDTIETAREAWDKSATASYRERELGVARFWQGFETSLEFSSLVGGGKWALVPSGSKMKSRTVLNSRRFLFDPVKPESKVVNVFVERLLSVALSFSIDSLQRNPEKLIQFLDMTSHLRTIHVQDIDRDSPEAFCFFVNVYHLLLQHALLFSVSGPLHKRSFHHFMRTSCYEIGGDVFSLAELYACVIRGNMNRPTYSKPPFLDVPKKSSAYKFYALKFRSANTNFLLNTADVSCLRTIPVLNPIELSDQLYNQTAEFLNRSVSVDISKKQVTLPKVFEVYKTDFGANAMSTSVVDLVRYCKQYLDSSRAKQIQTILEDPIQLVVKFHSPAEQFYSSLKQRNPDEIASNPLSF